MAAFYTSFTLMLGILFAFSGLDMDKFVNWVNYSQNDYMLQVSVEKDDNIMTVPYNNCYQSLEEKSFTNCEGERKWLKIGISK
jgi:hypothetical protein